MIVTKISMDKEVQFAGKNDRPGIMAMSEPILPRKSSPSEADENGDVVALVVMLMQLFLGGRGAQFPVPWYLFTIKGNYLQVVLRR